MIADTVNVNKKLFLKQWFSISRCCSYIQYFHPYRSQYWPVPCHQDPPPPWTKSDQPLPGLPLSSFDMDSSRDVYMPPPLCAVCVRSGIWYFPNFHAVLHRRLEQGRRPEGICCFSAHCNIYPAFHHNIHVLHNDRTNLMLWRVPPQDLR